MDATNAYKMEQVLDVFISQLEIEDGKKKRRMSSVPEQDSNNQINTNENLRRSGRKRIRPAELEKRRVISKPKRLLDEYNSKDVQNYYLDKKIKRLPASLETIFEEPNSENNIMSTRKFKRCINFPSSVCLSRNKFKVKKRAMKAKKVSSRPKNKITMDMLLRQLSSIEENETSPK